MSSYDPIADWFDRLLKDAPLYRDIVLPSLMKLTGNVANAAICDVACGRGGSPES